MAKTLKPIVPSCGLNSFIESITLLAKESASHLVSHNLQKHILAPVKAALHRWRAFLVARQ